MVEGSELDRIGDEQLGESVQREHLQGGFKETHAGKNAQGEVGLSRPCPDQFGDGLPHARISGNGVDDPLGPPAELEDLIRDPPIDAVKLAFFLIDRVEGFPGYLGQGLHGCMSGGAHPHFRARDEKIPRLLGEQAWVPRTQSDDRYAAGHRPPPSLAPGTPSPHPGKKVPGRSSCPGPSYPRASCRAASG